MMRARRVRHYLALLGLLLALPAAARANVVIADESFLARIAAAKAAMQIDPRSALTQAEAAQRYAGNTRADDERRVMQATAQWLQSEAYLRLNALDRAAPLAQTALRTVDRLQPGSKLQADLLLTAGGIATEKAQVAEALEDYQRAHDVFRRINDPRSRAKALIQIASLYAGGNDHANALKYFQQARAAYGGDPGLSVAILNGQGNALKELGQYPQAERRFTEALQLARQMGSPLLTVTVLCNVARSHFLTNQLGLAGRDIAEAMRLTSTGEAGTFRPVVLALAAQLAVRQGDMVKAERLIDERFMGVDLTRTTLVDRDAHEIAYRIYAATGRNDSALRHLTALKRLDDEATKLARSTNAALMAARFDFANQELRIASLQRDEARRNVAFEQARVRTQRNIFLGAAAATAIVIILLGIGLFTIRRSRNQVRAANDDLAVTNTALGKALAAKTEFLATTSHEIRTPLNGILGMTQVMLADPAIAGATRDRLGVVHGAGVTMRALVDDILDVAKMETGNLTIEHAPYDLCAMLTEAVRMWEDQARAKGIGFTCDLAACPRMVMGDAARLRQIVFNLMSNALKFTASGEVALRVERPDAGRLRIVVADTGVGIDPDKCEEIFESFRQADTSTTRQFGGTGLGLAICRNLARAMDGDVGVTSTMGQGSRFTVDLPLIPAPEVAPIAAGDAATADTLLVADRNPITRAMLKTLMTSHAGSLVAVGSWQEARALLDRGVARALVDASIIAAEDAPGQAAETLAQHAARTPLVLLCAAGEAPVWAASVGDAGGRIATKPIGGKALIDLVYTPCDQRLVSQAA